MMMLDYSRLVVVMGPSVGLIFLALLTMSEYVVQQRKLL